MTMRVSHRAALAALSLGALLSACGSGGGPAASPTPTAQPTAQPTVEPTPVVTPTPTAAPTAAPTTTAAPQAAWTSVYLVLNGRAEPVRRLVNAATPARDAILALFQPPSNVESVYHFTNDVPSTARLNGIGITSGVATVDLSAEFAAGTTDSLARRVTQVVDTLTELGTVRSVLFHVDGRAVSALGGINLQAPVTRAAVEQWNPAILVEGPTFNQTVSSPLRIWGTSNTFEGAFRIRMWANGEQLFDYQVQATSGTGTRGSFDVTVRFTASGPAVLEAYEVSMKDGSHVNVVDIPLTLQQ